MKYSFQPKEEEVLLYDDGAGWRECTYRRGGFYSAFKGVVYPDRIMKMPTDKKEKKSEKSE